MNEFKPNKTSSDKFHLGLMELDNPNGENTLNNSLTISFKPDLPKSSRSIQNLRKERKRFY